MKYILLSALFAMLGMIAGFLLGPYYFSASQRAGIHAPCGLAVMAMVFQRSMIGMVTGAILGVVVARFLPRRSSINT